MRQFQSSKVGRCYFYASFIHPARIKKFKANPPSTNGKEATLRQCEIGQKRGFFFLLWYYLCIAGEKNSRFLDLLVQLLHLDVRIVQFTHGVAAVGLGLKQGHTNTRIFVEKSARANGSVVYEKTASPSCTRAAKSSSHHNRGRSTGAVHGRTGTRARAHRKKQGMAWHGKTKKHNTHEGGPQLSSLEDINREHDVHPTILPHALLACQQNKNREAKHSTHTEREREREREREKGVWLFRHRNKTENR